MQIKVVSTVAGKPYTTTMDVPVADAKDPQVAAAKANQAMLQAVSAQINLHSGSVIDSIAIERLG